MNEEKQVKKQLLKNMLLNLIAFSIIFYILGTAIYTQFSNSLYISADEELTNAILRERNLSESRIQQPNNKIELNISSNDERPEDKPEGNEKSPRLIFIIRDELGNITEDDETNNNLNSIFKSAKFNKNELNSIYETEFEEYSYRGINYKSSDGTYKQVLINVDAEKTIAQKFIRNLIISFSISLVAILIASYILSRKTLKPIVDSWKKQNRFVQDASHELRTPLSIIKVKQESLLEKPESRIIDNVEDISITLEETNRLTKLIKELMELAKSDTDQLTLNKEEIDIDKEIEILAGMYKDVAKTEKKTLNTNLKFNEKINVDNNKFKQLLVILLDNAIKYTKDGNSIDIRTYKRDNKFTLEVEDTGIGISKDAIDHVFERFYREEKSRNRQKGGMGLGLSIAYNIVMAHKGSIRFEKNREVGTRVIITLPRK